VVVVVGCAVGGFVVVAILVVVSSIVVVITASCSEQCQTLFEMISVKFKIPGKSCNISEIRPRFRHIF